MFDIWKNLKDLVKVSERQVYTTNAIFILHSKVTVVLLLAFSILVTSRQYLGNPIDCVSSADIKSIADNYCWIHSTFTRTALINEGKWAYEAINEDDLAPGIRPAVEGDQPRVYHSYYQWVWLVLFIQSGLFYIPYWLWRLFDRGRVKLLVTDLNLEVILNYNDDEKLARQKEAILLYLTPNQGRHRAYAIQYIICELLNTLNVILQIFVTDKFLNGCFSRYGLGLFNLSQKHPYQRSDQLARVFPTVTACRIATGGVAFGTMEYDLLCVLPINILNEKIYIFLWFWFLALAGLSILNLGYRLGIIMLPPLRRFLLRRRLKHQKNNPNLERINEVVLDCGYSDWFMLSQLADNLNPIVFAEILEELRDMMSHPPSTTEIENKLRLMEDTKLNSVGIQAFGVGGDGDKVEEENEEDEALNLLNPPVLPKYRPTPPQKPVKFLSSSNKPPSNK